jgi:hypothetical protein
VGRGGQSGANCFRQLDVMNEKLGPDIAVVGRHTRKSSNESGNVERSAGLGRRERGESVQRDRGVLAGEHSSDTRLGVSV